MQFQKLTRGALIMALSGFAPLLMAATATGSFKVNLTVQATCSVAAAVGTNDIDFGSVAPSATANLQGTSAADITVNCSNGTNFVINLTPQNVTSTTGEGTMKGAIAGNTDTVTYQLRQATGSSASVWGNTGTVTANVATAGNGVTGTGTGVGNALSFPVYATVVSTDVTPDTYSDTVAVSVVY